MGDGNALTSFLPLILLVVVFYFLLIRPQRKRQQEQLRMQNSLAPGMRVMTTTGLFGDVVAVDGEDVILEIAPGVETRWVKAAIGRVVTPTESGGGAAAEGDGKDETATEPVDSANDDKGSGSTKS